MPTIPFRRVNSIENDIPVCHPDRDLCQLRINDEGGVACFESQFAHTTSAFAATHNLALENYNDALEWLGAHYHDVCRSEYVDTSDTDNRFELFSYRIMNRSDVREEAQGILDAVVGDAAEGAGLPGVSDQNHFPTCIAESGDNNGSKVESIWLTAAEAEYVSSKFSSHDRMVGCYIGRTDQDGMVQFWLTSNPETLGGLNENMLHFSNGVIDRINEDIRNNQVPEGVRAQEILTSLITIREQNPFVSGIRAQISAHNDSEVIREMQERQGWWSMMQGFAIILLFAQPLLKSLWQKLTGRVRTTDYGEAIRARIVAERAAGRSYDVLGRDAEALDAWRMTDTVGYRNIMIDAPTQVGKDEVVRKMIIMKEMAALGLAERGPIPEEFVNARVIKINAAEFQRGTSLRGNVADKVAEIANWARKGPVIVYISEIDLILLSGGGGIDADGRPSSNTESPGKLLLDLLGEDSVPESWIHRTLRRIPGIGRFFKPPTTGIRDNIIMLGTTSRYQEVLERYPDLQARFNQLRISNLHLSEMVDVIYDGMTRTEYETSFRVKISKGIVDAAARIAEHFYRPVSMRTDRYTGETRSLNRFPAVKQVLEGAARIARERSRASRGSGTDVTIEDVIKSAEQRMNRTLDRAEVDALLRTQNINSIELPDNESPTQRRGGGPRGPDDPTGTAGTGDGGGGTAGPGGSGGTAAAYSIGYDPEVTAVPTGVTSRPIPGLEPTYTTQVDDVSFLTALPSNYSDDDHSNTAFPFTMPAPVTAGARAASGSEAGARIFDLLLGDHAYAYAAAHAAGPVARPASDPVSGTAYRTAEGVAGTRLPNSPTPPEGHSSGEGVRVTTGNPSAALPGSILSMILGDLPIVGVERLIGSENIEPIRLAYGQFVNFPASQIVANRIATGRSIAQIISDPSTFTEIRNAIGSFYAVTKLITDPLMEGTGHTLGEMAARGPIGYAASFAVPMAAYSGATSFGRALVGALESVGATDAAGVLTKLGRAASPVGYGLLAYDLTRSLAPVLNRALQGAIVGLGASADIGHLNTLIAQRIYDQNDWYVFEAFGYEVGHLRRPSEDWPLSVGYVLSQSSQAEIEAAHASIENEDVAVAEARRAAVQGIVFELVREEMQNTLSNYNGSYPAQFDMHYVQARLEARLQDILWSTFPEGCESYAGNIMKNMLGSSNPQEIISKIRESMSDSSEQEIKESINFALKQQLEEMGQMRLLGYSTQADNPDADSPFRTDTFRSSIRNHDAASLADNMMNFYYSYAGQSISFETMYHDVAEGIQLFKQIKRLSHLLNAASQEGDNIVVPNDLWTSQDVNDGLVRRIPYTQTVVIRTDSEAFKTLMTGSLITVAAAVDQEQSGE